MVRRDLINKNFWKNKKILITGHTGFKGVWLTLILKFIGVKKIYGLSINQNKYSFFNKKLFNAIVKSYFIDINNFKKLDSTIKKSPLVGETAKQQFAATINYRF